ncbi:MAG: L-lactate dehydrogenase [uncultured Nocardioidaceae bacterium]|uniref:L-lactate dehydrogenase n=1 Tax=uncultured Nocardioidaceae bacterium TaxID=253824 RepID=A0A6J4MKI6_9ACTN|nr:MAG: L-lactate dehydrogenase [uncultured Nocardioidaceae bacterium]
MPGRYVDAVRELARERLPEEVFLYFDQGAGDGVAAAEAAPAWDRFRFLPRVLRDVTDVDLTTTLLGTEVSSPFAIAPSTLQRAAHPEGEVAMARAAQACGSLVVVSSNAGTSFADIGAVGAPWWLQIYVTADRSATVPVIERAADAGARAIVLTADTPVVAGKYAGERTVWEVTDPGWVRSNFTETTTPLAAADKATDLGPHDIAWLAGQCELPVVVKGVLHPADARRCVDAGAAAVWVSNHGGRQLDRVVPTADALPAICAEVAGAAEVYVDGGVRRGTDALVAAALGARAAFLGRPALFALAADGSEGVGRVLQELASELTEALRLVGCPSLEGLPDDLLVRATGL